MTEPTGPVEEKGLLRLAGLRVTPQRLAILRYLRGTKSHPTADMVYRRLVPDFPGLSPNTVYLTLRALEEAALLRRISMEENVHRYDADVAPHVHLVCRRCGRVDDCNGELVPLLSELGEAVKGKTGPAGWEIGAQDSCFCGLCPDCGSARQDGKR